MASTNAKYCGITMSEFGHAAIAWTSTLSKKAESVSKAEKLFTEALGYEVTNFIAYPISQFEKLRDMITGGTLEFGGVTYEVCDEWLDIRPRMEGAEDKARKEHEKYQAMKADAEMSLKGKTASDIISALAEMGFEARLSTGECVWTAPGITEDLKPYGLRYCDSRAQWYIQAKDCGTAVPTKAKPKDFAKQGKKAA